MSEITGTKGIMLDPTVDAFSEATVASDLGPTHFIGIGGAGMSVLAEMLNQRGIRVTGSDREASAKTSRLEDLGIVVHIGQKAENVDGAALVVYSSAIKPDNPEIRAAEARSIPIVHRSDILALLMRDKRAVTVAGAHGKTTTSSLLAHILRTEGAGTLADPSYAIGGTIQGPDGSTLDGGHAGRGDVLVAEADESDGSFLKYRPSIAVITNAEPDHLDHYGTAGAYHQAFVDYAGHAVDRIIICVDDDGALDVLSALDADTAGRVVAYTTRDPRELGDLRGAAVVAIESESEASGSGEERFAVVLPQGLLQDLRRSDDAGIKIPVSLRIPGTHNARNATAAIVAATLLGMDPRAAARGAGSFLGATRRFQLRGEEKDVRVFDDYAHHPTEVAALLHAARRRFPDSRIRVLFQPHLFSRTRFFAKEFAQALSLADDVIVTGVFPARERQEDYPDVSPRTIVDAARRVDAPAHDWIHAVDDMHLAAQMMAMRSHHGDVVFTVGAGDITDMAPVILHALEAHRETCGS